MSKKARIVAIRVEDRFLDNPPDADYILMLLREGIPLCKIELVVSTPETSL